MRLKPDMYYIVIKLWKFTMLILIQYVNDGRSYLSCFLKFLVMSYFPRIALLIAPFLLTPNLKMFKIFFLISGHQTTI